MELHLFGQIYGCMGIPNHTRDLFRALIKGNGAVTVYPTHPRSNPDPYDLEFNFKYGDRLREYPVGKLTGCGFIFWGPDIYPKIASYFDRNKSILVGYLIFEWTKLAPEYIKNAMLMDYLCCPSQWHKDILINNGIPAEKIYILKAGLRQEYLSDPIDPISRNKKFLFVGKYEKRKCVDELLKCFSETVIDPNITLTLLVTDPHNPSFDVKRLPNIAKSVNIIPAVSPKSIQEMADLYHQHDFIVVPSRSGGIELPLIEAMGCGCIPIVTETSGMRCYMPEFWSYYIAVNQMIPMYDNRWFQPSIDWGVWAEPSWYSLKVKLLRAAGDINTTPVSRYVSEFAKQNFNYTSIASEFIGWLNTKFTSKVQYRL